MKACSGALPHLITSGYRVVMHDRRGYGRGHEDEESAKSSS